MKAGGSVVREKQKFLLTAEAGRVKPTEERVLEENSFQESWTNVLVVERKIRFALDTSGEEGPLGIQERVGASRTS